MGRGALSGAISEPAWKTKPSWYLVATDDKMIPPPAQRLMSKRAGATVIEVAGSHAVYVSQPKAVATLIEQAANPVACRALKLPVHLRLRYFVVNELLADGWSRRGLAACASLEPALHAAQ